MANQNLFTRLKSFLNTSRVQQENNPLYQTIHGLIDDGQALKKLLDNLELTASSDSSILPACLLFNSTAQSITTGVTTTLTFDSALYDNTGMHSTITNTNRITFATRGKYHISSYVLFNANATGYRYVDIRLNGSTILFIDSRNAVTTDVSGNTISGDYEFNAGDYIEVRVFQNSGSTRTATGRFAVHALNVTIANPNLSGGSSGLIAVLSYNPLTNTDKTTTSTVGVDVDATNLAITFVAPSSGNVLIKLNGRGYQSGSNYYWWNLRDSGGNVPGTRAFVSGTALGDYRYSVSILKTGLTPGTTYTYKWGFGLSGGTAHFLVGDPVTSVPMSGAAVMEIWSAP